MMGKMRKYYTSLFLYHIIVLGIHSLGFSQTILKKYDGSVESWAAVHPTSGSQDYFAVRYQIPGGTGLPYTISQILFYNYDSQTTWPMVMLTHANANNQPDLDNPIILFTNITGPAMAAVILQPNIEVNTLADVFFVIKFPEGEVFTPEGGPGLGADTDLESGYISGNLFSVDGQTFSEIVIFNLAVELFLATDINPLIFHVERITGDVFTKGTFSTGGADLAERIYLSEKVEPGDIVELDPENFGYYRKAHESSNRIAGIITTMPGFTIGNDIDSGNEALRNSNLNNTGRQQQEVIKPMLALMGRVPVKVTTENGPIKAGDLLTVSRKSGYAMLCSKQSFCNTVIVGKALEDMEFGEGLIVVLVMLP